MKKYLLLYVVLIIFKNSYGQQKTIINPTDIIIEGRIVDSIMAKKPDEKRKITIAISKYPFTGIRLRQVKNEVFEMEVNYNERFKIIIPATSERFYMHILYTTGYRESWSPFMDNIYMLERGDKIFCKLSDDWFEFSGKGSDKLNCQSKIYKINHVATPFENNLLSTRQEEKYMKYVERKRDSIFLLQKLIVDQYKNILGPSISETMLATCYGLKYFTWLRTLEIGMRTDNHSYYSYYKGLTGTEVYKNINLDFINKMDFKNLDASYIYADFIFYKIKIDQILKFNNDKSKTMHSEEYPNAIFQTILTDFSGLIRDKLLALFMLNYQRSDYLNNYLDRAIQTIESPFYKDILLEIKDQNLSGSPFYAFDLENTEGKRVKITDFDNKVLFIDFWFTGCTACAILREAMKPILEKYKNNKLISFISINTDTNKNRWLNSVKSGKYTDPEGINLFTDGLGDGHPLMKHYNMAGGPYIYLLKNGKIYTSPLPRPTLDSDGKQTIEGNTGKVINLIEQALKTTGASKDSIMK